MLLLDYFAQTEDPRAKKHKAHAISAKVSLADCASIAAFLRSAFLASGTLVLAGLFTGPALLPGSLFESAFVGDHSTVAVPVQWLSRGGGPVLP
jgi:hypothetical protein